MGRHARVLADEIARELKLPLRTGRRFLQRFIEEIQNDLVYTGRIEVRGLGTFDVKERPGRRTTHPKTGDPVEVGPYRAVVFRSSKRLRDMVQPVVKSARKKVKRGSAAAARTVPKKRSRTTSRRAGDS